MVFRERFRLLLERKVTIKKNEFDASQIVLKDVINSNNCVVNAWDIDVYLLFWLGPGPAAYTLPP